MTKYVDNLGTIIVATGFEKLPKVQKIANLVTLVSADFSKFDPVKTDVKKSTSKCCQNICRIIIVIELQILFAQNLAKHNFENFTNSIKINCLKRFIKIISKIANDGQSLYNLVTLLPR